MLSRIRGSDKKSAAKEKLDCKCVNVPISDARDDEDKIINVECSSHPGFCVLDESGLCTKRESEPHCSLSPVELIGETGVKDISPPHTKCSDICSGGLCGKKPLHYKIDLNNANDTGLVAHKQCQTCGPFCSTATCTGRSRVFFISWDKRRTRILLFIIIGLALWISIYTTISASSG